MTDQTHSEHCWKWHGHEECAKRHVACLESDRDRFRTLADELAEALEGWKLYVEQALADDPDADVVWPDSDDAVLAKYHAAIK